METSNEKSSIRRSASIDVTVEQMGGIDSTEVTFTPGVTILTGRNATNRTSFIRAIAGGLGGTAGTLKRDSKQGRVTLTIGENKYGRQYIRDGTRVRTEGNPYTNQSDLVDLFVCLLEDNPIRQAVRGNENLSKYLLAPVDTDELEQQIATFRSKRNQIDERLNEIERERKQLPSLENRQSELEEQLDDVNTALERARDELDTIDRSSTDDDQAESLLTELEETQIELERTESEIETQRSIREELAAELRSVRQSLSEMDVPEDQIPELTQEIDRLQVRESELSTMINELSTILSQNERVLEGDESVVSELSRTVDPTDKLDPMGQRLECWTCGNDVKRQEIATQFEKIEELLETKRSERKALRETLSNQRDQYESLQSKVDDHRDLLDQKAKLEEELTRRSESIEELRSTAAGHRNEIADLQSELEPIDAISDDDLSAYERLSELEYERGQLEQQLSETKTEISEIEYQVSKSDDLEARRETIIDRIESLRSRVDDLERSVIESFNTHMAEVLERLAYEKVERVWIERLVTDNETRFELHIVRTDDDGTVYEDSVTHLSESEREVIGLIVALAGYLTHEVHDHVPLLLLDSLEAIDSERIGTLVDYLQRYTDYFVLALLHEDAEELPESYDRIDAGTSLV